MNELKDFKGLMEDNRENAQSGYDFFSRFLYDLFGLLFGRVYWEMHDKLPRFLGNGIISHVFALLRWSLPVWIVSGVAWWYFGYELLPTILLNMIAVWLFSRLQPFTY